MNKAEIGDIVIFKPSADEVYLWEIPEYGATGSIKALTHNVGLAQMIGVYLPMCLVDFGMENYTPVYIDDLKLKQKNDGTTDTGTDSIN